MKEHIFHHLLQFRRMIPGASAIQRYLNRRQYMSLPREVFGINFRNPLGLSGMDHNGEFFNQLSDFGFGFVSIGPFSTKDSDPFSCQDDPVRTRSDGSGGDPVARSFPHLR